MTTQMQTNELKHRVLARKRELEARLEKIQADSAHAGHESAQTIKNKLRELDATLTGSWDDLKESTVKRLNRWLDSD